MEPVDDFRITNPPANPELLKVLTTALVDSEFRMRPLVRMIANSRVYQTSSEQNETNRDDEQNFSRVNVTRLPAEVLLDAIDQVTEVASTFDGYDRGIRAGQLPGINKTYRRETPKGGLKFLELFGKPARIMTCSCERMTETTLGQVFELTSGELLHKKLADRRNCLEDLIHDVPSTDGVSPDDSSVTSSADAEVIDELYWRTLSRPTNADERESLVQYVADTSDRRKAFEDILLSLIHI